MKAKVNSFQKTLLVITIIVGLLIAANTLCWYLDYYMTGYKLYFIANYSYQALLWGMLIAWAWSLFRLYRDIKHSEKLLPDKQIFILHGGLLTGYLIIYLVYTILV